MEGLGRAWKGLKKTGTQLFFFFFFIFFFIFFFFSLLLLLLSLLSASVLMPPQRKRRRKGDQISTPSELVLLGIGSDEEDPDDEDPQALSNLTCKKCRKVFSRGCNLSQHRCRPTPLEPTSADLSSLSPPPVVEFSENSSGSTAPSSSQSSSPPQHSPDTLQEARDEDTDSVHDRSPPPDPEVAITLEIDGLESLGSRCTCQPDHLHSAP